MNKVKRFDINNQHNRTNNEFCTSIMLVHSAGENEPRKTSQRVKRTISQFSTERSLIESSISSSRNSTFTMVAIVSL